MNDQKKQEIYDRCLAASGHADEQVVFGKATVGLTASERDALRNELFVDGVLRREVKSGSGE